ncbi:hypothetical protein F5Y18DRAFT_438147 [Xylariaceae sp. FL1019]|nr:hypothetical protein F5Y18DRAFT_438147 [Xylariaceae sp. FL1019]
MVTATVLNVPWQWSLDASSFLVLLGENEELGFRRARNRLPDILTLAPVSGLQPYLRSLTALMDVEARGYISPYAQMLVKQSLLEDGLVSIYSINGTSSTSTAYRLIALSSWLVTSNLLAFAVWSDYLRVVDAVLIVPATTTNSFPDNSDAAIFLGGRKSAFVLEGPRRDICRWTGLGLRHRTLPGPWRHLMTALVALARIGTFLLLSFMFMTIPNGTTDDQVVFIVYIIFGQLSTSLAIHRHTRQTRLQPRHVVDIAVLTRTHVYVAMLRRYKHDGWVDEVDILPKTPIWTLWSQRVAYEPGDAKKLWEECARAYSNGSDFSTYKR